MNCSEFGESLLDCLYREAPPHILQSALAHQMSCDSCRDSWASARHTHDLFAALPVLNPPDFLLIPILSELDHHHKPVWAGILDFFRELRAGLNSWQAAPALVGVFMVVATFFAFNTTGGHNRVASRIVSPLTPASQMDGGLRDQLFSNPLEANTQGFGAGLASAQNFESGPSFQNVAIDDTPTMDGVLSGLPSRTGNELEQKFEERKRALMESDADALMMRGRRLKAMGRVDLALKDFESIFRFYPDYSYMGDVLVYRAQCYAFQGNVDKAVGSLDDFVKKYPAKAGLIQPMIDQLKQQAATPSENP